MPRESQGKAAEERLAVCPCCLGRTTLAVCPSCPGPRTFCWSATAAGNLCPICGAPLNDNGVCTQCDGTGVVYEPSLYLYVTPLSGKLGDTFTFYGSFLVDENFLPGRSITLYLGAEIVGSTVTDSYGDYQIDWVADRVGMLSFHSEGVYP